jgi:NAD+ synthase
MKFPNKVTNHIVNWLEDYLKKSNMDGFVIGVSGGVDSALTSALCAKTGYPVQCIEMPIHQNKEQISNSSIQINWLESNFSNVTSNKVDLSNMFDKFLDVIPNTSNELKDLGLANTKARLRMLTLYYFSTINRFLVVGTGNKVEDFGIGFFTKYGDGGVDISPIADLLKSEIYHLAGYLNLPNEILSATPTDGLWDDDRNDEDQIGASYKEIEWAMNQNLNEINSRLSDREKEVKNIFTRLNLKNKHKMIPIPICSIPKDFL